MDGPLIYTIWDVWKERNRRLFSNEANESGYVGLLIHEDSHLFKWASVPRVVAVISDGE